MLRERLATSGHRLSAMAPVDWDAGEKGGRIGPRRLAVRCPKLAELLRCPEVEVAVSLEVVGALQPGRLDSLDRRQPARGVPVARGLRQRHQLAPGLARS
jgi:hypothetical protein